tara:strand:+ start:1609 stop:1788 length:180 start_codon:yes stop_codon:yes gene_type:complete
MEIFGTDIDINGNEIKKAKVENVLALPTLGSGDSGTIVFYSPSKTFFGWTGTEWKALNT